MEEHTVAKGVERVPAGDSDAANSEAPTANPASNDWPWVVPEGWTEDLEPRQMRLATYIAPDPAGPVEVAVTRFAGRAGGDLANVNRWRRQMGLPPVNEAGLSDAVVRFSAPGFDGYEVRIESTAGVMLAAGVFDEAIGQMWFVRATAPDAEAADRLGARLFGMARSIAGLDDRGDD